MIGLATAGPAGLPATPVHINHEGGQETVKIHCQVECILNFDLRLIDSLTRRTKIMVSKTG